MATNFLELATTLKYLGAKRLPEKKVNFTPWESVRSSRRHGRRGGRFVFEIRKRMCGLCLIGKIVPEHYTTVLKAALQKICMWPWKCWVSLDIPKIVIYISIVEFYKGVTQLGGR